LKILSVIGTLDPAYGGPVEALRQMTLTLQDLGHVTETVTADRARAPWLAGFPGQIYALGPSLGNYRYTPRLRPWLQQNAKQYDAVIACGIWQYQSLAVHRAALSGGFPYFVFVHGALDPWFKREFPLKHLKKWLYWPWAEYLVLRDASAVLFFSEEERLLARQSFRLYRVNEAVVDNGINAPAGEPEGERRVFFTAFPALREKRLLLFMSRLHRKKGLDLLINAFAHVAGSDPRLHLVVAGPDQEGLRDGLEARARTSGVAGRITWTGMLTGDARWGAYHAAEAFILPSHSENFGMVVAEALSRGLPVLISDKVNIWREIEEDRAGFVAPDTVAGTVSLLTRWLGLTETERVEMASRARSCFAARFEIRKAAEKLVGVIERHIK
jgi:glycosyltransferase involved in cell wall biosynthesis